MKITKVSLIIISIALMIFSYVFYNDVQLGLCAQQDLSCRDMYNKMVDVLSFTPYLVVTSLFAAFLPKKYFDSWLRFAWWGGPLVIGVIIYVNAFVTYQSGDMFSGIIENVVTLAAYLFFIIGSCIQLWRAYRSRTY